MTQRTTDTFGRCSAASRHSRGGIPASCWFALARGIMRRPVLVAVGSALLLLAASHRPRALICGRMDRLPTWPVAAGSFIAGFGVADVTGVRPLGGLVLLAGGAWCARRWHARVGTTRTTVLVGLALGLFAASHALADMLGSWGAVLAVTALAAAAAYALADAPVARNPAPA